MNLPGPWHSLLLQAQAEHLDVPEAGYAQLASVRPDGSPACRTVRPRALQPPARLVLTSDVRSAKVREFLLAPRAELCWYFPRTRQQFRLAGLVHVLAGGLGGAAAAMRERAWQELSPDARQRFTWPPPGAPLGTPEEFADVPPDAAPGDFAVLVLEVASVDLLDLRPHPHARLQATAGGQWGWQAVNP